MLTVLNGTATFHGPQLLPIDPSEARLGLDLPCKNVDVQTARRWACSSGWFNIQPESGYRSISFEDDKNFMKALQRQVSPGLPVPRYDSKGRSGWFFAMPTAPKPPPDFDSRRMMKTEATPFGVVINLNPCCFGEVYWVGGVLNKDFVVFAVWIPYSRWVTGPLPIICHFRPAYNSFIYGAATKAAFEQGTREVFGALACFVDEKGKKICIAGPHQPFLDSAWYYLLGPMAFVQQMLAAGRLAILVLMIPPTSPGPDDFFAKAEEILNDVVKKALAQSKDIESTVDSQANELSVSNDGIIFSANSFGGTYLARAARGLSKGKLRELWMYDCTNMKDGWTITDVVRRLYIAQPGNRGDFFSGPGSPWDREGDDWSLVDISRVPCNGDNLHDFCGRLCFSHSCSLSKLMSPLQVRSEIGSTLSVQSCNDSQEFWQRR